MSDSITPPTFLVEMVLKDVRRCRRENVCFKVLSEDCLGELFVWIPKGDFESLKNEDGGVSKYIRNRLYFQVEPVEG